MNELKPCPFCGSSDVSIEPLASISNQALRRVLCQDCAAEGPLALVRQGIEDEAATLWNAAPRPEGSE